VVAAASYEARPFGVSAGMSVRDAVAKCPHAVLVPGNPSKYVALSLRLLEIYKSISPLVEPMSIDEAFIDLRGTPGDGQQATRAAKVIQDQVEQRVQLTCSVGIGPNKLIAKMASRVKKPRGITLLTKKSFCDHSWDKEVTALWGIGEKTGPVLNGLGIRTVRDLAHADRGLLSKTFGINGPHMMQMARGEDDTPLVPYFQGVANKSMGHEHTIPRDITSQGELERLLLRLCDQVTRRVRNEKYMGRVVVLKLRRADFSTRIRQRALQEYTDDSRQVYGVIKALFQENWNGEPIRLLGVSLAQLLQTGHCTSGYLFPEDQDRRAMTLSVDRVRDCFGEESLLPAASIL
jgi:DNA polymerase-4